MASVLLSPCDSCLTLADKPQQYNPQYVLNYLNSRHPSLSQTDNRSEITITYNFTNKINVKLSSIVSLVNIYSQDTISINDLTVNHLFLYLFYHRFTLFHENIQIGNLNLVHLGKKYEFMSLYTIKSPTLVNDLKVDTYPTLLLNIRTGHGQSTNPFDVGRFITNQENFVDKSTGDVTYLDALMRRLKSINRHNKKRNKVKVFFKKIVL
ncbi:hypothetical protein SBY92_005466 [Candida maltosa Xu316]|uniref:Uncharacterized protein n=1 Tax=Candida maltosa (strain Xu316) TaxID=1245528 RepID=M3JT30_CANMX|nr:hypothetical protein G210_3776 [Candida maltosa Xu316]